MEKDFKKKYQAEKLVKSFFARKEDFWMREQERMALALFKAASSRVPAYKDFLKKNRIDPGKIVTFNDFILVPLIDKKNYLRQYPLKDLCWDGSLKKLHIFSATSGSTGLPTYFPRSGELNWQSSVFHELFLRNSSYGSDSPTLVIICFGMGVWIGGLITYAAFEEAGRRGHPITVIAPGINKTEVFNALRNLAAQYEQIILVGYPPFIKDILDESAGRGINLKKFNLRLLFAAEGFSEKFRDYAARLAHIKNIYLDTANIYGTAELGTMAFETPGAILIRRLAAGNKKIFYDILGDTEKTPTLTQYNPSFTLFESPKKEILLTGNNAIPLIRYSIGDRGGTISFGKMKNLLAQHEINLEKEADRAGIKKYLCQSPFVYIYERVDLSTTLYGLQIYPEVVKEALLAGHLNAFLTGKFFMSTKFDKNQDQYLEINLELKKDKNPTGEAKKTTLKKIVSHLCLKSSEFRELNRHIQEHSHPRLVFWPYEHSLYFRPGIKQKWVSS